MAMKTINSLISIDAELEAVVGGVSVHAESEAYSVVNLVSDMGGQLGLMMGVSFITHPEDPAFR